MKSLILLVLIVCLAVGASCRRDRSNERRYDLKGTVVLVEKEKQLVTISHEDIKGFMPAMTMPFTVPSESDLEILAPDDQVTATLVVDGSHSWLEELIIVKSTGNVSSVPAVVPAKEGDEVPNYTLRNQDNREIRLHDYRGKALLLTFIFTRCPKPEYCDRMSNNFAQVDRALGEDAETYEKTHLLSISFDPAYDTPQVLRSYGAAHTERYQEETFAHWEFAAAKDDETKKMAEFFGLRYYPQKDEIIHGLRTVIVTPEGKVAKVYTDNKWTPEEVVEELKKTIPR
ncbi:MAG TPA: SCO family protein [Pyrinomonadaceae bacterium]|nr:SCO family protein [Pyrinomonadaceae bacterium]